MVLKHKKTSEVVDVFLERKDGKLIGTYYARGYNNGRGGWLTCGIKDFIPVDVKTEAERKSDEHNAIVRQKIQEYKKLFKADLDEKKIVDYLEKSYIQAEALSDAELQTRIFRALEGFKADI